MKESSVRPADRLEERGPYQPPYMSLAFPAALPAVGKIEPLSCESRGPQRSDESLRFYALGGLGMSPNVRCTLKPGVNDRRRCPQSHTHTGQRPVDPRLRLFRASKFLFLCTMESRTRTDRPSPKRNGVMDKDCPHPVRKSIR